MTKMKFLQYPFTRRMAVAAASACIVALTGFTGSATAADEGSAIKLVVPFSAGGGTDSIARVVAQVLSEHGRPVIVDNRPGAGGSIGTLAVTQASPDGATLLLGSNGTIVLNPTLYPNLKYKVDRDLTPVAGIASLPYLIAANPKFSAQNISQLLSTAKARNVTFASAGNGTTNHLVGVLLQNMGGIEMTHVPYKGATQAMNDVISGQVDLLSADLGTLLPQVKAQKLKPLAVTGHKRVSLLPDVPTVAEQGLPGFDARGWFGIFVPKATPADVVTRLSARVNSALSDPRVKQRLHDLGAEVMPLTSDELNTLVSQETAKWRKIIVDNKVTADDLK